MDQYTSALPNYDYNVSTSLANISQDSSFNEVNQEKSVFSTIGLSILIGFISLVTVIGNLLVILSIVIFRKLRKIPNMFIVSLATADLIMGGVVLPFGAHSAIGSQWLLGSFACDVWTSVDVLSVTASICTLCVISLDRFVAITMPFKYSTKMTRNRSRCLIGFIWIISATIAFVPIHLGWWKSTKDEDIACYDDPHCCDFRTNQTYAVVSSLISFYIPLFVMIFAYSIVFKIAIQKRSQIQNREGVFRRASMPGSRALLWGRGEYRAVFTMGIIMGTFVVCWLPFFLLNVLQVFCDRCVPNTVFLVFNWLGYANSFFNPVIYCHSKEFRRAFKRILWCGLCRDGYQQTSRASLSVSYTPSLSARSSIRTETSLSYIASIFLSSGSSGRSRSSRLSTGSNKYKKESPVNGYKLNSSASEPNGNSRRSSTVTYNYTSIDCKQEPTTISIRSNGTECDKSAQLPTLDEVEELSSESEVLFDDCQMAFRAPRLLPNHVLKQSRSKSTIGGIDVQSRKRVLFKTPSQNDISEENSLAEFNPLLPLRLISHRHSAKQTDISNKELGTDTESDDADSKSPT